MYAKIAVNKNEYSREEKKKLNFKKKNEVDHFDLR